MKVVKCSDEAYVLICQVAAENKTYLADALDILTFKQAKRISELEGMLKPQLKLEPETEQKAKVKPKARRKPKAKVKPKAKAVLKLKATPEQKKTITYEELYDERGFCKRCLNQSFYAVSKTEAAHHAQAKHHLTMS